MAKVIFVLFIVFLFGNPFNPTPPPQEIDKRNTKCKNLDQKSHLINKKSNKISNPIRPICKSWPKKKKKNQLHNKIIEKWEVCVNWIELRDERISLIDMAAISNNGGDFHLDFERDFGECATDLAASWLGGSSMASWLDRSLTTP